MGKYLALENCYTSKGRLMPEIRNAKTNKLIWPGDVEELPDSEAAAFGKKHLKPMPAGTAVRRFDHQIKTSPGKTLTTKSAGKNKKDTSQIDEDE